MSGPSRIYQQYTQIYPNIDVYAPVRINIITPDLPEFELDIEKGPVELKPLKNGEPLHQTGSPRSIPAEPDNAQLTTEDSTKEPKEPSKSDSRPSTDTHAEIMLQPIIFPLDYPHTEPLPFKLDQTKPLIVDPNTLHYSYFDGILNNNGIIYLDRELAKFKPEYTDYDASERDLAYINHLNSLSPASEITVGDFEIVMSLFSHCASIIEFAMAVTRFISKRALSEQTNLPQKEPETVSSAESVNAIETETPAEKVNVDSSNLEENPAIPLRVDPCEVCGLSESSSANELVFCANCDVTVHEDCYGILGVPDRSWLCKPCRLKARKLPLSGPVACVLCGWTHGAFKQFNTGQWVHLTCALWMPRVEVPENSPTLEPVTGLHLVDKERYNLRCAVCRLHRGACIQCSVESCYTAFHPYCARVLGLSMDAYDGDIYTILTKQQMLTARCFRHSKTLQKGKGPLTDVPTARNRLLKLNEPEQTGVRHPCWRSHKGTFYLPKTALDAVQSVLPTFLEHAWPTPVFNSCFQHWVQTMDDQGTMFSRKRAYALEIAEQTVLREAMRPSSAHSLKRPKLV